ncbi:MAG: replicative DNA helicase [Gammaproteobacteria bacterium]|nr:replicative DNA helicase [Gammaproteobacteria bacterium]
MSDPVISSPIKDAQTERLRIPPHSMEAEQAILGGLMLDNSTWDQVSDVILQEDFYRHDHKLIFEALSQLAAQNQPLDVITVSEFLANRNQLDQVGGLAYLGTLAKNTPSASNIKHYAAIVRERAILRSLITIGGTLTERAFNTEGRSSEEILDEAERMVFQIAEKGAKGKKGFVGINELLNRAVDKIDQLFQQDNPITGVPTGFTDFDGQTAGLQPGDLVIVAGRPSMGKTTFAMNIAENVAVLAGLPVAVFSMEMPGDSLAMRMMSSIGKIDQKNLRSGNLADEDWPKLTNAVGILNDAPIFIDDTPALSPNELRARCRRLTREIGPLGLVVIDYLQLMQVPGNNENRASEISEISRNLKGMAKELNAPVIALSQLNRSLEQRPNKRPVMSDLRESGAIEQDADLIVFIYRDEVYNPDSPDKGTAEIIIGKQRNGPIGTVRQTFLGRYTRFEDYVPTIYDDEGYE